MNYEDKFLVEYVEYISADGVRYPFFGGNKVLMSWAGLGSPDINYITDRGPFQHGVSVRDWRYDPRLLSIELFESSSSRSKWVGKQAKLINAMRPNRSSGTITPGKIRVFLADGSQREIKAWLSGGPDGGFKGDQTLQPKDLLEKVDLFCEDPFWRDVDDTTVSFSLSVVEACLSTSLCFPFCVGSNTLQGSTSLVYAGTWDGDQITITIVGPLDSPTISNLTTGKTITLNYDIVAGESVTIAILPNEVTVTNNSGSNLIGVVTSLSDLVDFRLVTESDLSSDGTNQLEVFGTAAILGTTGISINYYTRFITAFGKD
jgi:hypothetical protein